MTQGNKVVILGYSTSHIMHMERLLGDAQVRCRVVPVPRQVSSNCGLCLQIDMDDLDAVTRILDEHDVPNEGIHTL